MPLETVLYLAFVVSMFAIFAAVLTYAEWATRRARTHQPPHRKLARKTQPAEEAVPLHKAA